MQDSIARIVIEFSHHHHVLQTGAGTLAPREVEILRSGHIKIVDTKSENGVIFVSDSTLLPHGVSRYQPQVAFYCFATACCDMTVLMVVRGGRQLPMSVNGTMRAILESTPNGIKNLFAAQAYQPGQELLLDFLGYKLRRFTELNSGRRFNGHIAANSLNGTYRQLEQVGFNRQCLPPELGGQLNGSAVDKWVRMRLSMEDIMSAAPVRRDSDSGLVPVSSMAKNEAGQKKTTKREREALIIVRRPNETDGEFAKRKNACYVRRNYHRQKIERIAAESEVQRRSDLNESLRKDNQRLERLLGEAKELINAMENDNKIEAIPVRSGGERGLRVQEDNGSDDDSAFASILLTADDTEIELADCSELT